MSDTAPTMRDVIARTDAEHKDSDAGSAKESKTEKDVPRGTSKDDAAPAAAATDNDDPLTGWNEAPPWIKRWGKDSQKAFRAWATDPNNGESWKHVGNELTKHYTDWGRQANEVGQLRQFAQGYAPVHDMLQRANQGWAMQGMSMQQGLGQLMATAESLARDPDATLAWLASLYRPKDPAKFLQTLAQATGADLNAAVQSAPYVDPAVSQMVNPLLQRLHGLEQHIMAGQQAQTQQQQQYVLQQIQAFENAVDDNGQPKHPYLRDPQVFPMILFALQTNQVPQGDLSAAYQWATERHLPAIQAKAKAAQEEALRKAATTTETSQQAKTASNNLQGSAQGKARKNPPPNSIREAIRAEAKRRGETIPSTW